MIKQTDKNVGILISLITIYAFLIVNVFLIVTKESIIAQSLAVISSVIFVTLLILFQKNQDKKRSET